MMTPSSPVTDTPAESFPPLFYCPDLPDVVGSRAVLTGDEAGHALGARRLQLHDDIGLFDGRGTAARAVVTAVDRRRKTLEAKLTDRRRIPAPRPAVHLACALPKGDRAAVLLDMATQLGMVRFTPLLCARGVVKPNPNTLDRLRRICLEACKQSRRFYLPELDAPLTPRELARASAPGNLWIAHPAAGAVPLSAAANANMLTLLIGPEGGFTDEEVQEVIAAGACPFSLGSGILRIETAAIAALALATLGTR
ncbi:MAG: 16S rRNA (uracil(1498)-N(3))-methyltransferase [Gammaproteobacteria bacterium]|nr:MAG: 16S rRNA (uracil(1498)-N(3))-methyltransferase [Gammaproteobacteria bacterium]